MPKAKAPGAPEVKEKEKASGATVKVKFAQLWSSDRGVFAAGSVAELPAAIAASLVAEHVAEEA